MLIIEYTFTRLNIMNKQVTSSETNAISDLIKAGLITDPDSAKGRLLHTAARLFREKGFNRTTVRDLANELGMLSGSLFYHYPNKEAILQAVIEESIRRALARMENALAQANRVSDKLRALIHCEVEAVHGMVDPGFVIMVPEWRNLGPQSQAPILVLRAAYEAVWREVLDQMYAAGMIAVEGGLMRHFIRGALMETTNWFKADGKLSPQALEEKLYLAIVRQAA